MVTMNIFSRLPVSQPSYPTICALGSLGCLCKLSWELAGSDTLILVCSRFSTRRLQLASSAARKKSFAGI
jgi:hypothetical protein